MRPGWSLLQPASSHSQESDAVHELANQTLSFLRDQHAVTSIEYAFMAALIAMVCVATVKAFGITLSALYTDICNKVTDEISGEHAC
jgi:Flp pilus assembly pilin Flp